MPKSDYIPVDQATKVIRGLMRELHFAYQGIETLPEDHAAKRAYTAAAELLKKYPE